ncbi:hypothetical protein PR048_004822 [Dryococelus australis]|uniref:Transposase Tc1-like domain-containing protein n=1 Tax=Dryococelus australis TaxID=614101 RepID=A0ABQ9I6H6_9NEOP|nr:hypothetical protein PR048_004822 [Dryococelus australis]
MAQPRNANGPSKPAGRLVQVRGEPAAPRCGASSFTTLHTAGPSREISCGESFCVRFIARVLAPRPRHHLSSRADPPQPPHTPPVFTDSRSPPAIHDWHPLHSGMSSPRMADVVFPPRDVSRAEHLQKPAVPTAVTAFVQQPPDTSQGGTNPTLLVAWRGSNLPKGKGRARDDTEVQQPLAPRTSATGASKVAPLATDMPKGRPPIRRTGSSQNFEQPIRERVRVSRAGVQVRGKLADPQKTPPTSSTVWRDSHVRKSGSDPAGYRTRNTRNAGCSRSVCTVRLEEVIRQHINDMPSTSTRSIPRQMGVSHSTVRHVLWVNRHNPYLWQKTDEPTFTTEDSKALPSDRTQCCGFEIRLN